MLLAEGWEQNLRSHIIVTIVLEPRTEVQEEIRRMLLQGAHARTWIRSMEEVEEQREIVDADSRVEPHMQAAEAAEAP